MRFHYSICGAAAILVLGAPATGQWGEAAQLVGQGTNSRLGQRVAIEGNLLFAQGVSDQEAFALDFTSVFEADAGAWNLADTPVIDGFFSVADISNGTMVLTRSAEDGAQVITQPEAFVLEKIAGAWTLMQTLQGAPATSGFTPTYDVAISGDTIMLTSTSADSGGGTAVDVFRRGGFSWQFEDRLIVSQPAALHHVDISGDIAVVKSTVLVDGPTGWTVGPTLLPDDGAIVGGACGVSQDAIVIGSHTSANFSGSAYVFEQDINGDWVQTATLTAPSPQEGGYFGRALAISGTKIAVGESSRRVKGKDLAGAAYIFEKRGNAWVHAANLAPGDGAGANYRFGFDVSISGGLVAVGSHKWGAFEENDPDGGKFWVNGPGAIYIYGCALDTDGDGLCDDWETGGIPYYDEFGDLQHYMLPGADPLRKDLYVEVDVMAGVPFMQEAIDDVVAAFANAPLTNADPSTGVTLHVLVDEMDIPFDEDWDDNFLEFDAAKALHFGTVVEHANDERLKAKALAYRYCLWVNKFAPSGAVGWGELRGNDFTVAFGGLPEGKQTREIMASTWMHELGHNLNLHHGGADAVNFKPNHVSVMNYAFDDYVKLVGTDLVTVPIDFSREATQALLESSLNEQIGVTSALYSDVLTFFSTGDPMLPSQGMSLDGTAIDYDDDFEIDTELVSRDLNNFDGANALEPLIVYNEWDLIILGLGGDGDYLDRQHTTLPPSELDVATVEMLDELAAIAFGDCPADLDGDGAVNGADLAALLAAWNTAGSSADLNGDGTVDGADLAALLAAWGTCG